MVRTVVVPESDAAFSRLLDDVAGTGEEVVIERDGEPVAVVINPDAYQRLLAAEREHDWAIINRLRALNADLDPDEVYAEVTAEIDEMRRERRLQPLPQP